MQNLKLASKISLNILSVLFGVVIVGSEIALNNAGAITAYLGQTSQQIINDSSQSEVIIKNFSDYSSIDELKTNAKNVTSKVTEEGAVLLKK